MATISSNRRSRRLSFQPLEERTLMAGDVAVSVVNGDLKITGDANGNSVAIFQTIQQGVPVADSFYVSGFNGTTINGAPIGKAFSGVTRDFNINLAGGSDILKLGTNSSADVARFRVPNDLRIEMGDGTNQVELLYITVADDTTINTGNGTDYVTVLGNFGLGDAGNAVDNLQNDVTINTNGGMDEVWVRHSFVRNDLSIDMGVDAKSNWVTVANTDVEGDLLIVTSDGDDYVSIDQVQASVLFVSTHGGDDHISIKNTKVRDLLYASLGAGNDTLEISDSHGGRGDVVRQPYAGTAVFDGGDGVYDRFFATNVQFGSVQLLSFYEARYTL